MAYEYQKYKKNKSSIIPIEEIYTDLDINENDPYVPNVGYRFDSPRRWCNDPSKNKSIGIRDLHLTPSSGDIRCRFLSFVHIELNTYTATWQAETVDGDGNTIPAHYVLGNPTSREYNTSNKAQKVWFKCISENYELNITPENNFEEIATHMVNFINSPIWNGIHYVKKYKKYRIYANDSKQYSRTGVYGEYQDTFDKNEEEDPEEDGEDVVFVSNKFTNNTYYLKNPISVYYNYDDDLSTFSINVNNFPPAKDISSIVINPTG